MKSKFKLKLRMPKGFSIPIQLSMLILSLIGVLMVISASMNTGVTTTSLAGLLIKQIIFLVVSYLFMVFVANNFSWQWFSNKATITLFSGVMLMLLLIPRFMGAINGQYNWISLGPITLQPSEFAKPFVICLLAFGLGTLQQSKAMNVKRHWKMMKITQQWQWLFARLMSVIVVFSLILVLVMFVQKDFGTGIIILLIGAAIFFMASHPYLNRTQKILGLLAGLGFCLVIFMFTPAGTQMLKTVFHLKNYQVARFESLTKMFEPQYRYDASLQQVTGLYAFARGGWFGNGLGASVQKYGYLPHADTDYILAIIVEEFGFFGFMVITAFYLVLLLVMFKYLFKVREQYNKLALVGVISFIFIHYLFNVGGTSGAIPLTGVPLLLISSGGSSQVAVFGAVGVVQNIIARHRSKVMRENVGHHG